MGRTVSIALATYNGGRFLREQLESYLAQTRLPDELVVGDDGSSDDTLAILEEFSKRAPFPVHVRCNAVAKGPARNFFETAQRCSGGVIFFSDQDDCWLPGKIEALLAQFSADPGCWLATHDAALCDAGLQPSGLTMGGQIEAASGGLASRDLVAGCCMAFDKRLLRLANPLPRARQHDAYLAHAAEALGLRRYLPEVLIDYRRHGANVSASFMSDFRPASTFARFVTRLRRAAAEPVGDALEWAVGTSEDLLQALERERDRLLYVAPQNVLDRTIADLSAKLLIDRRRLAIHRSRPLARPLLLAKALGSGTYRGTDGVFSFLRDLAGILAR